MSDILDSNLLAKTGKVITTTELGKEYDLTDIDGMACLKNRNFQNLGTTLFYLQDAALESRLPQRNKNIFRFVSFGGESILQLF